MIQPWREVCSIGIYKAGRPWIGYHSVLIRISMILWNSLKNGLIIFHDPWTKSFYGQMYLKIHQPYFPSGYIVLLVVMAYGQLFLLARCIRLRIHVGIKWLGLIQFLDEYLSGRNFHLLFS